MELKAAIQEFMNHCRIEKNLDPKTLKAYKTDLIQVLKFLEENHYQTEIQKITKHELRKFLEAISFLKPKSIKRKIATLRAFFNYFEFENSLIINSLRKMRIKIKEPFQLPKAMNKDEISSIFRKAYQQTVKDSQSTYKHFEAIRNIVVIELLFATGARVSEITNLKEKDIDLTKGSVMINGKGKKQRLIPICNKSTLQILKIYRHKFSDRIVLANNYFLTNRFNQRLSEQSVRNIIKKLTTNVSIKKHITPHVFRHSFATLLLENDVDIKYIQSLLGHSSIITTQIYTYINKEKQRELLISKHPREQMEIFGLFE